MRDIPYSQMDVRVGDMPRDINKLTGDLRRKGGTDRKRCTLYLHQVRLKEFQKLCDSKGLSASKVIDAWIMDTLAEAKGKK